MSPAIRTVLDMFTTRVAFVMAHLLEFEPKTDWDQLFMKWIGHLLLVTKNSRTEHFTQCNVHLK